MILICPMFSKIEWERARVDYLHPNWIFYHRFRLRFIIESGREQGRFYKFKLNPPMNYLGLDFLLEWNFRILIIYRKIFLLKFLIISIPTSWLKGCKIESLRLFILLMHLAIKLLKIQAHFPWFSLLGIAFTESAIKQIECLSWYVCWSVISLLYHPAPLGARPLLAIP